MDSKMLEKLEKSDLAGIVADFLGMLPLGLYYEIEKDGEKITLANATGEMLMNTSPNDDGLYEFMDNLYRRTEKKLPNGRMIIWENVTEVEDLKKLMVIDPETGVFNARFMKEELERELERVHRTGSQMALVLVDVDLGDSELTLRDVAKTLKSNVRIYDMVFRGDRSDFVLMLFAVNPDKAFSTGERLLKALKETGVPRVSIGMTLSQKAPSAEAMMRQAQRALYVVNARGGNDFSIY